ncbi:5'-3' exonuclease [Mycoplasma phocoeninasale]|nr:5'-3' exonuclease H3TH domain-containing protein [Mycoplasma phocoeninasale]
MNNKKILIIDGTYLAYRSYYATAYGPNPNILQTTSGIQTNAIVGFFNTVNLLIKNYSPTHIYFAFDSKIKTFRHNIYTEYKAGRQKAPVEFYMQLDKIQQLLSALNIQNQYCDGYEADDIIAKAVNNFKGSSILIFSGDQDLNQLIDENIAILKKIKGEMVILNRHNFQKYYDFLPSQVIDYKAMVGDASDNFKGILGIGNKSAIALLNQYQSLENIYNNINEIKPSLAKKLIEHKEDAMRDKFMATLCSDFELCLPNIDSLAITKIELSEAANKILEELELNSLKRKFRSLSEFN